MKKIISILFFFFLAVNIFAYELESEPTYYSCIPEDAKIIDKIENSGVKSMFLFRRHIDCYLKEYLGKYSDIKQKIKNQKIDELVIKIFFDDDLTKLFFLEVLCYKSKRIFWILYVSNIKKTDIKKENLIIPNIHTNDIPFTINVSTTEPTVSLLTKDPFICPVCKRKTRRRIDPIGLRTLVLGSHQEWHCVECLECGHKYTVEQWKKDNISLEGE